MQVNQNIPPLRDVVLLGGGHAHVQVLKSLAMRPEPGVRLTLISRELRSPYSGMLPGALAGLYSEDDIHIKLSPLCRFANARLIQAEVVGLDVEQQLVQLEGRPPMHFDVLSINTGAVPQPPQPDAVSVKPISQFLPKWQHLRQTISQDSSVAVVGAGAGGVELILAARKVLPPNTTLYLVGEELLPGHQADAVAKVAHELQCREVKWIATRASREGEGVLYLQNHTELAVEHVLWVTDVCAPDWLKKSGLATDERGFVCVDQYLTSTTHAKIFAAGDVAHLVSQPRPKSGVYAVRAGPYLAENLRRCVREKPLRAFKAQRQHLALIGTAHGEAIASRGKFAAQGRLWWRVKDYIDQRFMDKFNRLPEMQTPMPDLPASLQADLPDQLMRCGGCGAKLASDPLRRVLARLPAQVSPRVQLGIGDDAAVINNGAETSLLTLDGFRAMVDDPYLFGRVAAHHSLNDIWAMAANPTAVLAFVTLPLMAQSLMEEELFQLLSGVTSVLRDHDVPLVGGHSAEGAELGIGLTVVGEPGSVVLHKGGLAVGDHLIITKALGTGVVLAAAMQGLAAGQSISSVQASMDQSNAPALPVLLQAKASALTDVTGFGLAGHLGEMLRASGKSVEVHVSEVPVFEGVFTLFAQVQSSIQQANELALQDYELRGALTPNDPAVRVLADPQTSGGLLAGIPEENVAGCLQQLRRLGFAAADIGVVTAADGWRLQ